MTDGYRPRLDAGTFRRVAETGRLRVVDVLAHDVDWWRAELASPWLYPDRSPMPEMVLFDRLERLQMTWSGFRWRVYDAWQVLVGRADIHGDD